MPSTRATLALAALAALALAGAASAASDRVYVANKGETFWCVQARCGCTRRLCKRDGSALLAELNPIGTTEVEQDGTRLRVPGCCFAEKCDLDVACPLASPPKRVPVVEPLAHEADAAAPVARHEVLAIAGETFWCLHARCGCKAEACGTQAWADANPGQSSQVLEPEKRLVLPECCTNKKCNRRQRCPLAAPGLRRRVPVVEEVRAAAVPVTPPAPAPVAALKDNTVAREVVPDPVTVKAVKREEEEEEHEVEDKKKPAPAVTATGVDEGDLTAGDKGKADDDGVVNAVGGLVDAVRKESGAAAFRSYAAAKGETFWCIHERCGCHVAHCGVDALLAVNPDLETEMDVDGTRVAIPPCCAARGCDSPAACPKASPPLRQAEVTDLSPARSAELAALLRAQHDLHANAKAQALVQAAPVPAEVADEHKVAEFDVETVFRLGSVDTKPWPACSKPQLQQYAEANLGVHKHCKHEATHEAMCTPAPAGTSEEAVARQKCRAAVKLFQELDAGCGERALSYSASSGVAMSRLRDEIKGTCEGKHDAAPHSSELCGSYASDTPFEVTGNGGVKLQAVWLHKDHLTEARKYKWALNKADVTATTASACAFDKMRAAAAKDGVSLRVTSGFRTLERQKYLKQLQLTGGGAPAATPGRSNHGLGRAMDLNTGCGRQKQTATGAPELCKKSKVYLWLLKNAGRFGWKRTVHKEPWHYVHYATAQQAPNWSHFDA